MLPLFENALRKFSSELPPIDIIEIDEKYGKL